MTAAARRWMLPLAIAAFAFACALVAWQRLPAVARDTFWAEDGRTFIATASARGFWNSVLEPYAGYLHVVPHIVASVVVLLPVPVWAIATTAAACLLAGGLAAVVFVCSRDVVPWMPARLLIASLTVLAPLAPREVLGTIANVHSLFLWALVWILLYTPRTMRGAVALGVVALAGAMTEIQAVILLPLLLFRWRSRHRWVVYGGFVIGVVAQVVTTVRWPRPHATDAPVGPLSVLYGHLINAAMPLLLPQKSIDPVLAATGPLVGLLVVALVLAALAYVLVRGSAAERLAASALALGSFVFFVVDVETNPAPFYDYASMTSTELGHAWLTRYGVVPSMMLAAVVMLAASMAFTRARDRDVGTRLRTVLAVGACILLSASLLVQVGPQQTRRSWGPTWQPQVVAAAVRCEGNPDGRLALNETLGWKVTVECSLLLSPRPARAARAADSPAKTAH